MQAPHQWLSDFIKDTCVTMLKLICHWTAAMLFCCWTSAMLQCLILRVVLWLCTAPCSCVVALLPDQEVALLLLLHSVPQLRTLYNAHQRTLHTAIVHRTLPPHSLRCTAPALQTVSAHQSVQAQSAVQEGCRRGLLVWARIWIAILPAKIYGMAWRKMLGLAESVRSGISLKIVSPLGPHFDKIRSPSHVASMRWWTMNMWLCEMQRSVCSLSAICTRNVCKPLHCNVPQQHFVMLIAEESCRAAVVCGSGALCGFCNFFCFS